MVNDFYTKYKTEIEEIAKNTRKQLLEENIPFWENRILDVSTMVTTVHLTRKEKEKMMKNR